MRWRTLALFVAILAVSRVAVAQDTPSASDTALAREQYQDGMQFAQSGHWEQAYGAFSRAYGLVHRPALLANLASAEAQTGRLVEAAEHYRQFLREVTSGREASQRSAVQTALDALDGRIPRARIVPDGSRPGDTYALDGRPIPSAAIGTPYPIDPGDHVLVVTADGAEIGRTSFTMRESESRDVGVQIHRPAPRGTDAHPVDTTVHETHDIQVHHDDVIAPPPPVEHHDDGGVLASPVFWVIVGIVVAAGAAVGIVLATQGGRDPFGGGNLGTVVVP
jgi:hypothetical protein